MATAPNEEFSHEPAQPPQLILRAWVKELAETGIDMSPGMLLPMAIDRFAHDPEFMRGLMDAAMPGLVAEALRMAMASNRQAVRRGTWFVSDEQLNERQKARWERWYENNGVTYQPLKEMRRGDLAGAIQQRQAQVATQITTIEFLRALQAGLRNDHETIEERYGDTELARLFGRFFGTGGPNE